jgi:hypothetical protein
MVAKRTCILITVFVMILSVAIAGLFAGLANYDEQNKKRLYTEANMVVLSYFAQNKDCSLCSPTCYGNSNYNCGCYHVSWTAYIKFSYNGLFNGTLHEYFGSAYINCGNTKTDALDIAKNNPYYKVGDTIKGWYENVDPSVYILQNPTSSFYWAGTFAFSITAIFLLAVILIIAFNICRSDGPC